MTSNSGITSNSGMIKVTCGAEYEYLDDVEDGLTLEEIEQKLREMLNIGSDFHVFVNGNHVSDKRTSVKGGAEVEFKKPSGQKGD